MPAIAAGSTLYASATLFNAAMMLALSERWRRLSDVSSSHPVALAEVECGGFQRDNLNGWRRECNPIVAWLFGPE
jgi:hypothetical protein